MVSGLFKVPGINPVTNRRIRRDPEFPRKNRGNGWYYYRGNLDGKGPTYSKYTESEDKRRPHLPWKVKDIDAKERTQPHKGDYRTIPTSSRDRNKVRVKDSRRPGYVKKRKFARQRARDPSRKGYF